MLCCVCMAVAHCPCGLAAQVVGASCLREWSATSCVHKLPVQAVMPHGLCELALHAARARRWGKLSVQLVFAGCLCRLSVHVCSASCQCKLPVYLARASCPHNVQLCIVSASCQCTCLHVLHAHVGRASCLCNLAVQADWSWCLRKSCARASPARRMFPLPAHVVGVSCPCALCV